jgi:2-isopropylmalate synthase
VSGGRDALAQVFVKVRANEIETSGRGTAQDVLEASAKAYINAVNRVFMIEKMREENQRVTIK